MSLIIFDLDWTLLEGDTEEIWARFLIFKKIVGDDFKAGLKIFFDQYEAGNLDMVEYQSFMLKPLTRMNRDALETLREEFLERKIRPIIRDAMRSRLTWHRNRGDILLIITATVQFLTDPIAAELGVENLLATEAEEIDGRFTGRLSGTPCFREGKVERLETWLKGRAETIEGSWFYSDSHNDIPLLEKVDTPIAVTPDKILEARAKQDCWPIIRPQTNPYV